MSKHILLTALGRNPRPATYVLGESEPYNARLSPVALFHLLPEEERFEEVVAICTDDAKKDSFHFLEAGISIPCKPLMIPDDHSTENLQIVLHRILESIPENSKLTLDVTHGLRYFSFLFFTAGLYLQALKNVTIYRAWYGLFEKKDDRGYNPFVDMSILLRMVEWFYAVNSFKELRNPEALAYRMKQIETDLSVEDKFKKSYSGFVGYLDDFACLFGAGLPLELGHASSKLQKTHSNMKERYSVSEIPIPLAEDLMDEIALAADPFCLSITRARGDWKQKLPLDQKEISRQVNLIDRYFDGGFYNNALGLLRELVITRAMMGSSLKDKWLNKNSRGLMERKLGALKAFSLKNRDDLLERQKLLGDCWDDLTQGRNELHHHGMKNENVKVTKRAEKLKGIWTELKNHLDDDEFWNVEFGGGSGTLLVTPLGLFPGFLYTALNDINPDQCLVIASNESKIKLEEIKERSSYKGVTIPKILDAYHGFDDIQTLVSESEETILGADRVFCNLTGGTTALQYAVIQLENKANDLGKDVIWIAVVDERAEDEQKAEPYVLGEIKRMRKAVRI